MVAEWVGILFMFSTVQTHKYAFISCFMDWKWQHSFVNLPIEIYVIPKYLVSIVRTRVFILNMIM